MTDSFNSGFSFEFIMDPWAFGHLAWGVLFDGADG